MMGRKRRRHAFVTAASGERPSSRSASMAKSVIMIALFFTMPTSRMTPMRAMDAPSQEARHPVAARCRACGDRSALRAPRFAGRTLPEPAGRLLGLVLLGLVLLLGAGLLGLVLLLGLVVVLLLGLVVVLLLRRRVLVLRRVLLLRSGGARRLPRLRLRHRFPHRLRHLSAQTEEVLAEGVDHVGAHRHLVAHRRSAGVPLAEREARGGVDEPSPCAAAEREGRLDAAYG